MHTFYLPKFVLCTHTHTLVDGVPLAGVPLQALGKALLSHAMKHRWTIIEPSFATSFDHHGTIMWPSLQHHFTVNHHSKASFRHPQQKPPRTAAAVSWCSWVIMSSAGASIGCNKHCRGPSAWVAGAEVEWSNMLESKLVKMILVMVIVIDNGSWSNGQMVIHNGYCYDNGYGYWQWFMILVMFIDNGTYNDNDMVVVLYFCSGCW